MYSSSLEKYLSVNKQAIFQSTRSTFQLLLNKKKYFILVNTTDKYYTNSVIEMNHALGKADIN